MHKEVLLAFLFIEAILQNICNKRYRHCMCIELHAQRCLPMNHFWNCCISVWIL